MDDDENPRRIYAARITKALKYAEAGAFDGEHHKTWVIDQMVRALTGCPMVTKNAIDAHGLPCNCEAQGESADYKAFIAAAGGAWEEGIAPQGRP